VNDKHNTKYNTLISGQPYACPVVNVRDKNEHRPGHETPWINSGTIPAIPGRLASLLGLYRDGNYHYYLRWNLVIVDCQAVIGG